MYALLTVLVLAVVLLTALEAYHYLKFRRFTSLVSLHHDYVVFLLNEVEGEKAVRLRREEKRQRATKRRKKAALLKRRALRTPLAARKR